MTTHRYPRRWNPEHWWRAWEQRRAQTAERERLREGIRQLRRDIAYADHAAAKVWP